MRFVLVLLFVFIQHMCIAQSKAGKQWAQYDRYVLENKAISKSPDVVFIGNSITYNWAKLVPEFFERNNYLYSINPEKIDCDYFNYLKSGKPEFIGEYMSQYSWAEETCGLLWKKRS